jgi:pilus assembly protein Flp/PilA
MHTFKTTFRHFTRDSRGATAIEYALIAGGVSVAILSAVTLVGTKVMETFYNSLTSMF